MIRFYSTCIFLCAPFFISAQENIADSLFQAGDHLHARVAYERLLFQGSRDVNRLLLKKTYCLKAEGRYDDAYQTLQRADFFQGSDSLRFKLYYEVALNAYLAGKYDLSLNKIQELNYYLPKANQPVVDLLEILSLNQQHKLNDAEKKLEEFLVKYNLRDEQKIYRNKKLKNPEKAESMSHLLPGVGQMYAGYGGQGATSMLLQTGFVAFAAFSFLNGYYFSGAFTGVGLFYIFNNGGARHARYLAEKRNDKMIAQLNADVKKIMMKALKK